MGRARAFAGSGPSSRAGNPATAYAAYKPCNLAACGNHAVGAGRSEQFATAL